MKFHHVGIATQNLEKAIEVYLRLGYSLKSDTIYSDPLQKVDIAFMERHEHPMIELLMPNDVDSPIQNILSKSGSTPYHTCYEVPDIEKSIAELKTFSFIAIMRPVPAVAFDMRKICFLYNKHIGLMEILEES